MSPATLTTSFSSPKAHMKKAWTGRNLKYDGLDDDRNLGKSPQGKHGSLHFLRRLPAIPRLFCTATNVRHSLFVLHKTWFLSLPTTLSVLDQCRWLSFGEATVQKDTCRASLTSRDSHANNCRSWGPKSQTWTEVMKWAWCPNTHKGTWRVPTFFYTEMIGCPIK